MDYDDTYHRLIDLLDQHGAQYRLIDHPTEGRIVNMTLPNKLSRGARQDFTAAPKLGQHSVEILGELGYGDDAIRELVDQQVTVDGTIVK